MMNTRLCKVWSERHLPADIWPEILSRLPVKSLLRFRCVSKSWRSLVDDADLARLHLNNFKNNRDETHLLVVQGRQRKCAVWCSDTFDINSETLHILGKEDYHGWDIVCCVDGLVLLKIHTRSDRFSVLKVWNPSIRKFSELPSLPKIKSSPNIYLDDVDIGLGYDPLDNDYKLVKLIFLNYKTLHSVAIYSLGGGSWKIIKFQGKGSSCSNWRWERGRFYRRKVYFQGSLYFLAEDAHSCLVRDLVSFDLSNEEFSFVSMPDDPYFRSNDFRGWSELVLIDGGCPLAVVDSISRDKSVWVLESSSGESEAMYWTKQCSFCLKFVQFLYLKKNGDILTRMRPTETLTITSETRKKKSVRWDQMTSYSPETGEYKILQQKRA